MAPMRLPPLPSVKDLLRIYQIEAAKKLSQNFLLDNKLQSKLVSRAGKLKNCYVIEVGPGPGTLTRSIFEQGAAFAHVIEKDSRFLPTLELLKDGVEGRLAIHVADILRFKMKGLMPKELFLLWEGDLPKIKIIGNLPFGIASPLIIKWLKEISERSSVWESGRVSLTLTFQEEVAQRMVASPNDSQRSRLSIMCQNWCEVYHKFVIPGKAFVPKPDVNVSVVHFIPRKKPIINFNFPLVEKVVNAIFLHRQKYCKKCIANLFPYDDRDVLVPKILTVADIDYTRKPYELTMKDFDRLVHSYAAILDQEPRLKKYLNVDTNPSESFPTPEEKNLEISL